MSRRLLIFLVVLALLYGFVVLMAGKERREGCTDKGGTVVTTDRGHVCAKLEIIKP